MNFFFKLERKNNEYTLNKKKQQYTISNLAIKLNNINMQIKKKKSILLENHNNIDRYNQFYFLELLNININNAYCILSKDFNKQFYIVKLLDNGNNIIILGSINNIKNKYPIIFYNMISKYLYQKLKSYDYCKREELLFFNKLYIIYYLYDFLEIGGTFFTSFQGFCNFTQIFKIYNILSLMFDYCIIFYDKIICKKFNPILQKSDLKKIIDNNYTISFNNDLLISYLKDLINYKIKLNKIILTDKKEEFEKIFIYEALFHLKCINPELTNIDYYKQIINNLKNESNKIFYIEGNYITNLIKNNNLFNCIEIGMGYGIYSYYILNVKNTKLISIDNKQKTKWNNAGINLLKEFKLLNKHKLYITNSYIILPKLLKKIKQYKFILIDGFNLFSYTIINFFYSNLLLHIGGYIIINDALHEGVSDCIKYIKQNFPFYEKIDSPITLAVFKKISDDNL